MKSLIRHRGMSRNQAEAFLKDCTEQERTALDAKDVKGEAVAAIVDAVADRKAAAERKAKEPKPKAKPVE